MALCVKNPLCIVRCVCELEIALCNGRLFGGGGWGRISQHICVVLLLGGAKMERLTAWIAESGRSIVQPYN